MDLIEVESVVAVMEVESAVASWSGGDDSDWVAGGGDGGTSVVGDGDRGMVRGSVMERRGRRWWQQRGHWWLWR
ncbi:hypothetical protein F0562_015170 [Nyssa sinensis]|uniref:Uncharacterized protein n=1 Tax=Nyssa sinensis TaxID=561372 RepID=A0A5J4ZJF3_9ASTE|nr:hypothetical protein F0562_015170 [Nyssa sinensis]